jgi:thymidylate synthase (FAD)
MIGQTQVNKEEVDRWMRHVGADDFELPPDTEVSNPAMLIALAGKRCYMSFTVDPSLNPNITRIREDYVAYFDNILASGHGSVLEHAVYNFAIEGVSRVFTAEMNRHRAGWAVSEGSLRFIRFGENIPYWEPDSISGEDFLQNGAAIEVVAEMLHQISRHQDERTRVQYLKDHLTRLRGAVIEQPDHLLLVKQQLSREAFRRAFTEQENIYTVLETIWADELAPESKFAGKKQVTSMMRRIVGLGVATGGVWSGNIRALRHVFAMRASAHAEEEMIHVFSRVVKIMAEKEPLLFGDFYRDDDGYWRPKYVKV